MPFARTSAAAQPSPTPPTPPATGNPPPPPAPSPAAAEPRYYVAIGGQSVLMPKSEAQAQNPNLPCMTEDQKSGWQTVAVLLPMANPMRTSNPPAAGGFAGRAGQPQAQQGGTPANLYAGVENAEVYRKGALFTEGEYIARVARAEYIQGRQKNMVLIELEIITSSYDATIPATQGALREGVHATAFIIKNDNFLSNIKEVVLACSGFDAVGNWRKEDDVVTAEECNALTAPEQAFAGALVYLEAKMTKTRAGADYTRVNWWPCPVHPAKDAAGQPNPQAGQPDHTKLALVRG